MANGKKSFIEQYALFAFATFCTLGAWVYFKQSIYPLAQTTQVVALQKQVNKDTAKTDVVVKQVKQQSSQAAGSAAVAQAAADKASKAADAAEAAASRKFASEPISVQVRDLAAEVRSLKREQATHEAQIKALQQGR